MTGESPFDREPIDRAYRCLALAQAVLSIARSIETTNETADPIMAIRHVAEAIGEEALACISQLENQEAASLAGKR